MSPRPHSTPAPIQELRGHCQSIISRIFQETGCGRIEIHCRRIEPKKLYHFILRSHPDYDYYISNEELKEWRPNKSSFLNSTQASVLELPDLCEYFLFRICQETGYGIVEIDCTPKEQKKCHEVLLRWSPSYRWEVS